MISHDFRQEKIHWPVTMSVVVPDWLSPATLPRRLKRCSSTGNMHGYKTPDHLVLSCPLPTMFGSEDYAYSLLDFRDDRFACEAATMSKKLVRLFYDAQIIDLEWRKTYKQFVEAEKRKANLTPGVLPKSREKAERELQAAQEQLIRLQEQRDLFNKIISRIWDRCGQIKSGINKEKALEELREEMATEVAEQYPLDDSFWTRKFRIRSGSVPPLSAGRSRVK
jgi:hypothetical protein